MIFVLNTVLMTTATIRWFCGTGFSLRCNENATLSQSRKLWQMIESEHESRGGLPWEGPASNRRCLHTVTCVRIGIFRELFGAFTGRDGSDNLRACALLDLKDVIEMVYLEEIARLLLNPAQDKPGALLMGCSIRFHERCQPGGVHVRDVRKIDRHQYWL